MFKQKIRGVCIKDINLSQKIMSKETLVQKMIEKSMIHRLKLVQNQKNNLKKNIQQAESIKKQNN